VGVKQAIVIATTNATVPRLDHATRNNVISRLKDNLKLKSSDNSMLTKHNLTPLAEMKSNWISSRSP